MCKYIITDIPSLIALEVLIVDACWATGANKFTGSKGSFSKWVIPFCSSALLSISLVSYDTAGALCELGIWEIIMAITYKNDIRIWIIFTPALDWNDTIISNKYSYK